MTLCDVADVVDVDDIDDVDDVDDVVDVDDIDDVDDADDVVDIDDVVDFDDVDDVETLMTLMLLVMLVIAILLMMVSAAMGTKFRYRQWWNTIINMLFVNERDLPFTLQSAKYSAWQLIRKIKIANAYDCANSPIISLDEIYKKRLVEINGM